MSEAEAEAKAQARAEAKDSLQSIKKLAEVIFNGNIIPEKSIQLHLEEADNSYVFQILIHILIFGLKILGITNDTQNIIMENINPHKIINLGKRFKSIGFKLKIDIHNNDNKLFDSRYCRVSLDNENKTLFIINKDFIYNVLKNSTHDIENMSENEIEEIIKDYNNNSFNLPLFQCMLNIDNEKSLLISFKYL